MNTSRRSFLGGMAVASVLTSAGAAAASTATAENPELVALGAEFDAALSAFEVAAAHLTERQDAYRRIAPVIPTSIAFDEYERRGDGLWLYSELLDDVVTPRRISLKGPRGHRLRIVTVEAIDRHHAHDTRPEVLGPVRATAAKYEADVATALQTAGLADALDTYGKREGQLRRITRQLALTRSMTPAGLGLKVRATSVYADLVPEDRQFAAIWIADAVWNDLGEAG